MYSPFRLEYLDAERLLPVLVRKAAGKGLPDTRHAGPECADRCPPTYEARSKRWTERARTGGNSHCAPTIRQMASIMRRVSEADTTTD
jgi:hypothetical protein